jgi:hypothetical protein
VGAQGGVLVIVIDTRPLVGAGSEYRYHKRVAHWRAVVHIAPRIRHNTWWILHNVVAHTLIGALPTAGTIWFHDWTSQRLNVEPKLRPSPPPELTHRRKWIFHNVVAHVAIGLVPCAATFAWHDRTADEMGEPNWV